MVESRLLRGTGADTIEAKDLATGRSYPAVVLGADAHHDVAVVQHPLVLLDLPASIYRAVELITEAAKDGALSLVPAGRLGGG